MKIINLAYAQFAVAQVVDTEMIYVSNLDKYRNAAIQELRTKNIEVDDLNVKHVMKHLYVKAVLSFKEKIYSHLKEFIRVCPILPKDYLRKNYAFLGEKFMIALETKIDL